MRQRTFGLLVLLYHVAAAYIWLRPAETKVPWRCFEADADWFAECYPDYHEEPEP